MKNEMLEVNHLKKCEKNIFGILLAAGMSSRFGTDKLVYNLGGNPLFLWSLRAACNSDLTGIIVVCGDKLVPYLPLNSRIKTVINSEPQKGQASSLRLGLSMLPAHSTHALILLADQPLISTSLINNFIALAHGGCTLSCLSNADYLGPPVLFAKKWFKRLKKIEGDYGAKRILIDERKLLHLMPVQFNGQEKDIDLQSEVAIIKKLLL